METDGDLSAPTPTSISPLPTSITPLNNEDNAITNASDESYHAANVVLDREYCFNKRQPLSSFMQHKNSVPVLVTKSLVSATDSFFCTSSKEVFKEEGEIQTALYGDGSSLAMRDALRRLMPSSDGTSTGTGDPSGADKLMSLSLEEMEEETICGLTEAALLLHSDDNDGVNHHRHRTHTAALEFIQSLGAPIPRRVCQRAFRKNDIVWACRTCQTDRTCVLCHDCYTSSDHDGHDVVFYRAQSGGCCDCGDADAWDPKGFCSRHGAGATDEATEMVGKAKTEGTSGSAKAVMDWIVKEVLGGVKSGFYRVNGQDGSIDPALRLGELGRGHSGLYLVLHADDVSWSEDRSVALQELYTYDQVDPNLPSFIPPRRIFPHSEEVIFEIAKLLFQSYGDIVMWGTNEIIKEAGFTTAKLWKEGDEAATRQIGELMLRKSKILNDRGLICSIKTHTELLREGRAAAALDWLNAVAQSCDPLSLQVGSAVSCQLDPMLRCNLFLPRRIASSWNSLLLTLVAAPTFKGALASAYVDAYHNVASDYARGIGSHHWSSYALSVQFLNRASYVKELAQGKNLMETIVGAFLEMLRLAEKRVDSDSYNSSWPKTKSSTINGGSHGSSALSTVDPLHTVLTQYRYHPILSDLRLILDVPGIARLVSLVSCAALSDSIENSVRNGSDKPLNQLSFLDSWIKTLALCQNMDGQVWRTWGQTHVENEHQSWMGAYMLSVSLGDIFERLLAWEDKDPCPIEVENKCRVERGEWRLLSASELTIYIMSTGLNVWQASEMESYKPTANIFDIPQPHRCPSSLPYSTVAVGYGTDLAMEALSLAQVRPFSFHIPLHRFVAACLREVARRPNGSNDTENAEVVTNKVGVDGGIDRVLSSLLSSFGSQQLKLFLRGLLEFPVIVISRVAQIRSSLWKRNGYCMDEQVSRYDEQEYCRSMKDADLMLVQFAIIANQALKSSGDDDGCAYVINLLLHRFGLFDFAGFDKAPDSDTARYLDEVRQGLYQGEVRASDGDALVLPWTYTPAREPSSFLALLEQLLQLIIVVITELPPPYPTDRSEEAAQAKTRLRREVIHKLVSGPKSHSELTEVFMVLSKRDNNILSEEGKLVNPDDAMGATLEEALSDVADRKASRGKGGVRQWELRRQVWAHYDPCYYHMSPRSHQIAGEKRPSRANGHDPSATSVHGAVSTPPSEPYAPRPPPSHPSFLRIRRDLTSDATIRSMTYRTLHVHCRKASSEGTTRSVPNMRGKDAYERKAMSERVLAHTVHLLTLGAYAWKEQKNDEHWRSRGGGGKGSIFYHHAGASPTVTDWVQSTFLADPCSVMRNDWYTGEECSLLLLRRLAHDGSNVDGFTVQDAALRSGAMWLCEFATEHSPDAAALFRQNSSIVVDEAANKSTESEHERKIRMARERFERMKLANKMKIDALVHNNDDNGVLEDEDKEVNTKARLMKEQPQCAICFDNDTGRVNTKNGEVNDETSDGKENNNALAFCGYVQPSMAFKGGGGLPHCLASQTEPNGPSSNLSRLVGTHITLCGHSLHSACCNSHLQAGHQHGEFQCPMCKRLCNCLVPFVDIGVDWIKHDEEGALDVANGHGPDAIPSGCSTMPPPRSMHEFLSNAHWRGSCRAPRNAGMSSIATENLIFPVSPFSDGATSVCRKLMTQIENVSYEADIKRLGKDELIHDPGEFRYPMGDVEYKENHAIWENVIEWPPKISLMTTSEQEISKKKLLSKLLLSIQALAYTCCSEAAEIRRQAGQDSEEQERMYSKFGVRSVEVGGDLIVLPEPSPTEDDGNQPFKGRFGKLRYLALSIMVAATSISHEIVRGLLDFPAQEDTSSVARDTNKSKQSPIVYPLLCGHILSHVVAAMCAACGEAWGSDVSIVKECVESEGRTTADHSISPKENVNRDSVFSCCEAFIGLGFLARVLQVFIGSLRQAAKTFDNWNYYHLEKAMIKTISNQLKSSTSGLSSYDKWQHECGLLIKLVLPTEDAGSNVSEKKYSTEPVPEKIAEDLFFEASAAARRAGTEFLFDVAVVLQVLAPGWSTSTGMLRTDGRSCRDESSPENKLNVMMGYCRVEPIKKMLESALVRDVVTGWYKTSKSFMQLLETDEKISSNHERNFRILDWPMPANFNRFPTGQNVNPPIPSAAQARRDKSGVPLLGGHDISMDCLATGEHRICIKTLPTSYTDLYAKLGTLCPEFEQTALCMVCGQVLNACLEKECVKHAYHCGAGTGVFFLLQRCSVLITHNKREAYTESPFVDSHGETSQYSGRPLNLDMDRYDILREMWSGHQIYERVVSEQGFN